MSVRLINAGLGRTGGTSLSKALRQLLGPPCYRMTELVKNPSHCRVWDAAARGESVNWPLLFSGYGAVVDWPAASFWYEISQAFPDAVILLSLRDPQSWWQSASQTIFHGMLNEPPNPVLETTMNVFAARFTTRIDDQSSSIEAFERHYDDVRQRAPADRLLPWCPADGWQPICERLDLPVPAMEFPHSNSRREFLNKSLSKPASMVAGHHQDRINND